MKKIVPVTVLAGIFSLVSCNSYKSAFDKNKDYSKFDYISTAVAANNDTLWTVVTDKPLGHNPGDRMTGRSAAFLDKFTRQEVGVRGDVTIYVEEVAEQSPASGVKINPLKANYDVTVYGQGGEKIQQVTTKYKPDLDPVGFHGGRKSVVLKDKETGKKYKAPQGSVISYTSKP